VRASVAGLLMEEELRYLGMALHAAKHPYVAVLGGAKVPTESRSSRTCFPRVTAAHRRGHGLHLPAGPRAAHGEDLSRRTRWSWRAS